MAKSINISNNNISWNGDDVEYDDDYDGPGLDEIEVGSIGGTDGGLPQLMWLRKHQSMALKKPHHFVLVHGAGHGAWCWYKVETLLKSAGNQVTSLDLAACGINPKQYYQVLSDSDLYEPLTKFMESLPVEEKVILVGHSYSGTGVAMIMESFPNKIAVAVFVTATMPGPALSNAAIAEESSHGQPPRDDMDNVYKFNESGQPIAFRFGPEYLSAKMYHLCSPEDSTLASNLVRYVNVYQPDEPSLSDANYGSVRRAFVISQEDKVWRREIQKWITEKNPPDMVKEIHGSDHMVMLSKPRELSDSFMDIAESFA
ncbi:Polyneuridine-aldehyde esterase [Thalictrum thalictroides]|uniref:Polyneuridine-aldehyde esterase n=1 Tax=Thalictrum thalictroides TaxID=46969 RepID=A0A7J6VHA3_THATH|nr:Polyneuridine-aldehyde esterase [Thalictrum thalictroides]